MVRAFMNPDTAPQGELFVEELFPNCVEVFFVPSREKMEEAGLDPAKATEYRVKLLLINGQDRLLTIFPTNTRAYHHDFLQPKYDKITDITLEDVSFVDQNVPETPEEVLELLEELPSGFTKDCDYGLGLAQDYRFIIDAVEGLSECTEIVISRKQKT